MRGGKRDGSGRPSSWKDSDTATIRIPKSIQSQVMEFARQLDSLEQEEALWQITAPHSCAGLIVAGEKVKDAAPILKWSIGKDWPWVRDYPIKWDDCAATVTRSCRRSRRNLSDL